MERIVMQWFISGFSRQISHAMLQSIFKDTNGLFIGDVSGALHVCLAGEACGGTLLANKSGGGSKTPYSHGVAGYFGLYGTGQFDGQSSGHDFMGTVRFEMLECDSSHVCRCRSTCRPRGMSTTATEGAATPTVITGSSKLTLRRISLGGR
eukprot:751545-Hanusia_phi.AAC.3